MRSESTKFMGIPKKWVIILSGAIFYAYQSILRVAPNVMVGDWMLHFQMDSKTFGIMVAFYYSSYALIQIPLGIMLDRFGAGRLMVLASFMCSLSCFWFNMTDSTLMASTAMFLMGLGSACAFLGSIKLGTVWFTSNDLAKVVALVIVIGTIGSNIGSYPLNLLIERVGWKLTMDILGVVGLIICMFLYMTVGRVREPYVIESSSHILAGIKNVITRPQAWLIALYGMFMYAPMIVYSSAWGVPFIKTAIPTTEGMASLVITSMFWGAAIGSPIFAFYSDYIMQRKRPMIIGALLALIIQLIIVFVPHVPLAPMFSLFFFVGFCYAAKTLSFTAICEIFPKSSSGLAVGFLNMLTMGAGVILHPLIGGLVDFHWDGTIENGVNVYSQWDYRFALVVLPICLGLALLLMKFIRETHHTVLNAVKKSEE